MVCSLLQLNTAEPHAVMCHLAGLYEHSPWIVEKALAQRPFQSLAHFKWIMVQVLQTAERAAQLAVIRAHPQLAAEQTSGHALTTESAIEQTQAGLMHCTNEEVAHIQQLNQAYYTKFGFPFILAVRGPRGKGLLKKTIIETFSRRLLNHPDVEFAEALRNIHRIAEIRLNDKLGYEPVLGNTVWDWQEDLAQYSEADDPNKEQLTVTYLSEAHRACANRIQAWMQDCGFDEVNIDAVGNVVGRYHPEHNGARYLLTGSHYDTVRNGGKYDGRLGIFVPMACVQELHQRGLRLPYGIEVIAFAEEEGQRYKATFLGSSALVGDFQADWLTQPDVNGITMRTAMEQAGLRIEDIPLIRRNPADYLGFIEVHIEQGPVLNALNLPLGIVSSINGSTRYMGEFIGTAGHAGTTPMHCRNDAALGAAELALYMEQRAAQDAESVATMGMLQVPNGSINVIPGRCVFSIDLRAPCDAQRNALQKDVLAKMEAIAQKRGLQTKLEMTMQANAAPSDPVLQMHWESALMYLGIPVHRLPSGAGHDAMKLHEIMPQAMLFTRGQNSGISHNPLESTTSDDMQLAVEAFAQVLQRLATAA